MPVDPQIQSLLDMAAAVGNASLAQGTPQQARDGFRMLTVGMRDASTLAQVRSVEDVTVPGAEGPRPARVYRPDVDGAVPTVLFVHGGGFVIGDLDTHDDHARLVCQRLGAVVVSLDYRLAPEHPFPAGHLDSVAAFEHVVATVADLGGDRGRIAVGGDSAGGNLAAALAVHARDHDLPLKAQLLLYPAVDFAAEGDYPSRVENATGKLLTADDMLWFGAQYLGEQSPSDPRASVIGAELSGVAPALVATAEFDPLRDEGEAFAALLEKAGVQVVAKRYDGMIHGFFGLGPLSAAAQAAVDDVCSEFARLLA